MPSFFSKLLGRKKHADSDLLDGERYEAVPADVPPTSALPENSQSPKSPPHKSKSHGLGLNLRRRAASPSPPPEHDTTSPAPMIPPSLPSLDLHTTKPEIKEDEEIDLRPKGLTNRVLNDEDLRKKRLTPADTLYLVQKTAEVISERGLEVLGVMRPHWFASPNHHEAQLKLLNCFFQSLSVRSSNEAGPSSSSEDPFENELRYTRDPHDVAAVFRWGLRHLHLENDTFALSTIQDWYQTFANSERSEGYPPQAFDQILSPLLPNIHVQLICAVLDVITSLAAHSEMNGISGNKLSKVLGWWIVNSRTVKESEWLSFYADWDGTARKFEHLFLAYIRAQATHSQMPRRLIELVKSYPFEKYGKPDDGIFLPRTRLSTRTTDALFIRIAVQADSDAKIHPLRIITDALNSLPAKDVSGDYLAIWESIREAVKANPDEDKGDSRKFNLPAVFADESLRLLSLVPGMGDVADVSFFPTRKTYQPSFSLVERPLSLISNGDQRSTTDKAQSPSMTNLDLDHVTDWQAFSTTGFRSPSGISLTASLWDNDVEITTPPIRRNGTKHTLSLGSTSEPHEEAVSPTQPAAPTTERVATPVETPPSPGTFSSPSLVKLDEAFVDFWADTLLDSVAQSWPAFVVCQLKPMPNLKVKDSDKSIEWMVIERVAVAPEVPPKQEVEAEQLPPIPSTPTKPDSAKSHGFFSSLASPARKRWSLFSKHETAPLKRERSRGRSGSKVGEMGEILKEEDETASAPSDAPVTAPQPPPKESDMSITKSDPAQESPKPDEAISQDQLRADQLSPIPEETKTEDLSRNDVPKKSTESASVVLEGSPPVPSKTEAEEVPPDVPSKLVEPEMVRERVDEGARGADNDSKMEGDTVIVDDNVPLDESAVIVPKPENEMTPTAQESEPSTEALIAAEPMLNSEGSVPVETSLEHKASIPVEIKSTADEAADSLSMGVEAPVTTEVAEPEGSKHPELVPAAVGAAAIAAGAEALQTHQDSNLKVNTTSAPHSPVAVAVVEPTPIEELGSSTFSPVAAEPVIEPIEEDDESVTPQAEEERVPQGVESVVPHVESIGEVALPATEEPEAPQPSTDEAPLAPAEVTESLREEDLMSSSGFPAEAVEASSNLPEKPLLPSATTIDENEQITSPEASKVKMIPTEDIAELSTSQENVHLPVDSGEVLGTEVADNAAAEPLEASFSPKNQVGMVEDIPTDIPTSEEPLPEISDSTLLNSQETQPADTLMISEAPSVSNEETSHADDIPVIEEHPLPGVLPVTEAVQTSGDSPLTNETPGHTSALVENVQTTPSETEAAKAPAEVAEVAAAQESVSLPMDARDLSTTEDADVEIVGPPEESHGPSKPEISTIEEVAAAVTETPASERTPPATENTSANGTQLTSASAIPDEASLASNEDTSQVNVVTEKPSFPEVLPVAEVPTPQLATEETSNVQSSSEGDLPVVSETSGIFDHPSTAMAASSTGESGSPATPELPVTIEENKASEENIPAADAPVIEATPSATSNQIHEDTELPAEVVAEQDVAPEDPSTTDKDLAEDASLGSTVQTSSDAATPGDQSDQPIADVRREEPRDGPTLIESNKPVTEEVPSLRINESTVDDVSPIIQEVPVVHVPVVEAAYDSQELPIAEVVSIPKVAVLDDGGQEIPQDMAAEASTADENENEPSYMGAASQPETTINDVTSTGISSAAKNLAVAEDASTSKSPEGTVDIDTSIVSDEGGVVPEEITAPQIETELVSPEIPGIAPAIQLERVQGEEPELIQEVELSSRQPTPLENTETTTSPDVNQDTADVSPQVAEEALGSEETDLTAETSAAPESEYLQPPIAEPLPEPLQQSASMIQAQPEVTEDTSARPEQVDEFHGSEPTTFKENVDSTKETQDESVVPASVQDLQVGNVEEDKPVETQPEQEISHIESTPLDNTDEAIRSSETPLETPAENVLAQSHTHTQPQDETPILEDVAPEGDTLISQDGNDIVEPDESETTTTDPEVQVSSSEVAPTEGVDAGTKELEIEGGADRVEAEAVAPAETDITSSNLEQVPEPEIASTSAVDGQDAVVSSPAENAIIPSEVQPLVTEDEPATEAGVPTISDERAEPTENEVQDVSEVVPVVENQHTTVPLSDPTAEIATVEHPSAETATEVQEPDIESPPPSEGETAPIDNAEEINVPSVDKESVSEPKSSVAPAAEGQETTTAPSESAEIGSSVVEDSIETQTADVEHPEVTVEQFESDDKVLETDVGHPSDPEPVPVPAPIEEDAVPMPLEAGLEPSVETQSGGAEALLAEKAGVNDEIGPPSIEEPSSKPEPDETAAELSIVEPISSNEPTSVVDDKPDTTVVDTVDVSSKQLEPPPTALEEDTSAPLPHPEVLMATAGDDVVSSSLETTVETPDATHPGDTEVSSDEALQGTPVAGEEPISEAEPAPEHQDSAETTYTEHKPNALPSAINDHTETQAIDTTEVSSDKLEPIAAEGANGIPTTNLEDTEHEPTFDHQDGFVTGPVEDAVVPTVEPSVEESFDSRPVNVESFPDQTAALTDGDETTHVTSTAGVEPVSIPELVNAPVVEDPDAVHIDAGSGAAEGKDEVNSAGLSDKPAVEEAIPVDSTVDTEHAPEAGPVTASSEPLVAEDASGARDTGASAGQVEVAENGIPTNDEPALEINHGDAAAAELVNEPVVELPPSEPGADAISGVVEEIDETNDEGISNKQVEPVVDETVPVSSTAKPEAVAAPPEPIVIEDSEAQGNGTSTEHAITVGGEVTDTSIATNAEPISEANHVDVASSETQDTAELPDSERKDVPNDVEPSVSEERGDIQTANGEKLPEKDIEPAEDKVISVAPATDPESISQPALASVLSESDFESLKGKDNGEIQANDIPDGQTERLGLEDEAADDSSIAAKLKSIISEPTTVIAPAVEGLDAVES